MAQLMCGWLNEEVHLSRRVTHLGEDFKDGYLLGELLSKYNQQANFNQFSAKGTPDAKINNFCLLEPTLRNIGVPFNAKTATEILQGKEGTIKNLLYELKTALEAITRNTLQNGQTKSGYVNDKIYSVIYPPRPSYDKTIAISFENALRATMDNTNEVLMEKVTRRFQEQKGTFRQSISAGHSTMMENIQTELQRTKELERTIHDAKVAAHEAKEKEYLQQWKTNQIIARERRDLRKKIDFNITSRRETMKSTALAATRSHTITSIDDFDQRLEATILASASSNNKSNSNAINNTDSLIKTIKTVPKDAGGAAVPELMYIDQEVLKQGLNSAQKKMKEHHEDVVVRQQMNDRRRRRFLREFDNGQTKLSQCFFEKDVTTQLLNLSTSEVEENKEMDKALAYKKMMTENRNNRLDLIAAKQAADSERTTEWTRVEAQREMEWVVHAGLNSQQHRSQSLLDATFCANRQQNIDIAYSVVQKIVDMTEWVISCRELGVFNYNAHSSADSAAATTGGAAVSGELSTEQPSSGIQSVIPEVLWRDCQMMFTSALSIARALPPPDYLSVSMALNPFCISHRPLCQDVQWLFNETFKSQSVLYSTESSAEDSGIIAAQLSKEETLKYIVDLNEDEKPSGYSEPLAEAPNPALEALLASEKDLMLMPDWVPVSVTASKYFLGETIIAIRCAVNPLPKEADPVVSTGHIPLKAAICGVSDLARRSLAECLARKIPHLLVIRTEELIKQALSFREQQQQQLASDSAAGAEAQEEEVFLTPDEESEEARDKRLARELRRDYVAVCERVFEALSSGNVISDALYVSLITHAIKLIPPKNNGFIIQDFPNTANQALLLMEALSGIRYDIKKPQAYDKASIYAPYKPCEEVLYATTNCGLNVMVNLDSGGQGISKPLDERVRARSNLYSGEIDYLADDCTSVVGYQEVFDVSRPRYTSGLDLTVASQTVQELKELFSKFKILDDVKLSEYASLDEAVTLKANELCDRFIPPEQLDPEFFIEKEPEPVPEPEPEPEPVVEVIPEPEPEPEPVVEAPPPEPVVEAAPAAKGAKLEKKASAVKGKIVEPEPEPEPEVPPLILSPVDVVKQPPIRVVNSIHPKLAASLMAMWDLAESQSQHRAGQYFHAFRDVRYQMVQRRRCAADCISNMLVRLDRRQDLFDEFRKKFNALESDQRFDPDCVAELHLLTLELGDAIFKECEDRKVAAEEYVKQVAIDGTLALAIHRNRCESAMFAQAEFNRFNTALHLLFDYTKAVKGFDMRFKLLNEVEATLPVTLPSLESLTAAAAAGGKGKDKKEAPKKAGKDAKAGPVAFREPINGILLPNGSIVKLPEPKAPEVVDPKAKKPKEKKGAASEDGGNPFVEIETAITEKIAAKWAKGVFTASREVYEGDEVLCSALENAIWFEAEKLLVSLGKIKTNLANQTQWLESMEANLIDVLNAMIDERFHKELNAGRLLQAMIADVIEVADDIPELWIVSPDSRPQNPKYLWRDLHHYAPRKHLPPPVVVEVPASPAIDVGDDKLTANLLHSIADVEQQVHGHDGALHHPHHHSGAKDDASVGISRAKSADDQHHDPHRAHSIGTNRPHSHHPHHGSDNHSGGSGGGAGGGSQHKHHSSITPPTSGTVDEQFRRATEKYHRERKLFEEKMKAKRNEREEEFVSMGMSESCAKLAAYNELVLEESHMMQDFDSHHKPHHNRPHSKPGSAASGGGHRAHHHHSAGHSRPVSGTHSR